jgi:tetratricopeptide (TPR) repeat protein
MMEPVTQPDSRRLDDAIDAARQAVANDDSRATVWHDLGVLYQHRGALAESRAAFERALALDPALASAYNNLGNTFTMLGEREAAVASYRRALAIDASLDAAHANAAVALHGLGNYHEALVHARAACALAPEAAAPHITAAFIAAAAHGPEAGLTELSPYLARHPEAVRALAARAHLLLRLDRSAEALAAAQAGLLLEPNDGLLIESLGCAHRSLGHFDKAFAAFDRAIALGHDVAQMHVFKASGLLEIGEFDAGRNELDAALAVTPDLATAWHALTDIRPFAAGDPLIATMEEHLAESPRLRDGEGRALMHFSIGKAYHKSGDPAHAFVHFAAGNALKRALISYDPAGDDTIVRTIMTAVTPAAISALSGTGDTSAAPIFIVGMPRSGTTLAEQILASHPDVYGAGELTLFDQAVAECASTDFAAIGARYIASIAEFAPGKRIVDKLPSNFRNIGLIKLALPNARIIHITRAPLDTCFSCFSTYFTGRQDFAYDQVEIGRFYRGYATLMRHWHAVLPPGSMLDVAYEDAVTDLASTARRMLAYCDLDWTDDVLAFHRTPRVIRTASYHQARRPIYTTSISAADPYRPYLQPLIEILSAP